VYLNHSSRSSVYSLFFFEAKNEAAATGSSRQAADYSNYFVQVSESARLPYM
jgi:hypothetical protein